MAFLVHLTVGGGSRSNPILVVALVVMSVQLNAHGVLLRLIEQLACRTVRLLGSQRSIRLEQLDGVVVGRTWYLGGLITIY